MTYSEVIRFATQKPRKPKKKSKSFKDKVTGEKRVILQGKDYTGLRWQKYQAAEGKCQIPWRDGKVALTADGKLDYVNGRICGKSAPFYTEYSYFGGQLCHWPPKKMGNSAGSDTPETTVWGCGVCHDALDGRNSKVIPSKREFECREGKA